jgi:hypothetical protein
MSCTAMFGVDTQITRDRCRLTGVQNPLELPENHYVSCRASDARVTSASQQVRRLSSKPEAFHRTNGKSTLPDVQEVKRIGDRCTNGR